MSYEKTGDTYREEGTTYVPNVILEDCGCKWVAPRRDDEAGKFPYNILCKWIDEIVQDVREEDLEEWSSFPTNYDLRHTLIVACNFAKSVRVTLDEQDRAVAISGVSSDGKGLWSIWAKPRSPKAIKALVRNFGVVLDEMRIIAGVYYQPFRKLYNYISPRNTFFIRLLEKHGATFIDADEYAPGYKRFEV